MKETSTDYRHPQRPAPVRLYDTFAGQVPLARVSLDPEVLLAKARRAEGLQDFGPPDPAEPLAVLCRSLQAEAALTPTGRFVQQQRILAALRARLRLVAWRAAHPEVATHDVTAPVVISALQRTGTTLLHRLLAAHPDLRALRSWEALNPAPFPRPTWNGSDKRHAFARRAETVAKYLAPDFFAVHPVDAEAPEEDVILLDQALCSTLPEATIRTPTYAAWVEARDAEPAYRYLHDALQALSAQVGPARWVLKTPHHMEYLDTLLAVFPGARIVWTHRDPLVAVASFCSMVAHARGLVSDDIDPEGIGAHWSRKIGRMIDRALATRDQAPPGTFLDVRYDDLVQDPLGTVHALCDALDLPWSPDIEARIEAARARSPRHQHGKHVYRLADFALDPAMLAERFAPYRTRFVLSEGVSDRRPSSGSIRRS